MAELDAYTVRQIEQAQMERDVEACCEFCGAGDVPVPAPFGLSELDVHRLPGKYMLCQSTGIRREWAKRYPGQRVDPPTAGG